MKRLFVLVVLLFGVESLMAQDKICKRDNSVIEAKVTEISPDEVRYKKFSNLSGPTYVLPVESILYIEYENGEREVFNEVAAPVVAPVAKSDTPAVTPTDEPVREVVVTREESGPLQRFSIGEYYEWNGTRGVVCALDEDRQHGLLISLEETTTSWDTFEKDDLRLVGANNKSDGVANMEIVERYINENGLSWDNFPAFKWCRELGEGWYLPSIDEWLEISFNFNGGSRSTYNRTARNRFNDSLKSHGGKKLDRLMFYYSSTETDEKLAMLSTTTIEPPYVESHKKNGITWKVRAVKRF